MHILIAEDDPANLMVLRSIIGKLDGCTVETVTDGIDAHLRALEVRFDLIVADQVMPGMTGTGLVSILRQLPCYENVPMIVVTADGDRATRHEAIIAGATDFLNKPLDPVELKARVRNLLALRRAQIDVEQRAEWLTKEVATATAHLAFREEEVIWRLARAIECRDGGTGDHISRVATISRLIAEGLDCDSIFARTLYLAAPLHDVGKIGVPDMVLSKPGKLTPEEIAIMRTHVPIGVRILEGGTSELIRVASRIAATHHEKWDGTGYPNGLNGEQIPLEGRIAAVADVFDALCSERPYKKAFTAEAAYEEIARGAGGHFDPACVAAFQLKWDEIVRVMNPGEVAAA
ncbi:MAG: HD domain-containing phosphohydrolase [Cypionkella sp.]